MNYDGPFKPVPSSWLDDLRKKLEESMAKAVREHTLAINELTEKQTIETLTQVILSGDIVKLVRVDGAQCVIYMPYERCTHLERRIEELEPIAKAADELEKYLSANCGSNDEWPVDLIARDVQSGNQLTAAMNKLCEALKPYRERKENCL